MKNYNSKPFVSFEAPNLKDLVTVALSKGEEDLNEASN